MTVFETEALAVVCLFAALALIVSALVPRRSNEDKSAYRRWKRFRSNYRPSYYATPRATPAPPVCVKPGATDFSDVGAQLNAIMNGVFTTRRVMNRSEYEVFKIVESEVAFAKKGHRAFAQTSLGQVLESPNTDAFRSINAKRVDVLVVDRGGWPVFAVEYQGGGHYQGTAAARDAIKKEALRRAGVGYVEVVPKDGEEQLRCRIRELLGVKAIDPVVTRRQSSKLPGVAPQFH